MATLPSNTPSNTTRALLPSRSARATLQSICAALERGSDAAAAHRAHQSQTAPPKRFFSSRRLMQSHRLVVLHAAHAVTKSPLNAFHQTPKTPSCSHRISRIALTSHVARLVLFTHHTARPQAPTFAIRIRISHFDARFIRRRLWPHFEWPPF